MSKDTDRTRRLILISFWAVILLALPLWWKTTEIYRAQLPFTEIEQWSGWEVSRLEFPTLFTLHIASKDQEAFSFKDLSSSLEEYLLTSFNLSEANQTIVKKIVQFPVKIESIPWQNWEENESGNRMVWVFMGDIDLINLHLDGLTSNGHYDIYILPRSDSNVLHVRNNRQAILQIATNKWNRDVIEIILAHLIPSFFAEEQKTIKQFVFESSFEAKADDPSSMRTLKYSPLYQITFSLMNGDPSDLLVGWEIEEAVSVYLKSFLDEISVVSNFTIDSQVQHYAALTFEPDYKDLSGENNIDDVANFSRPYYYLTPASLPHFINSAEWNLASAVSSYPTINFILYVPSKKQSPLYIHDSKGFITENNAFLIPRWGGIVISNPDTSNETYKFTVEELKPVMEIFVSQLRGLLGVQEFKSALSPAQLSEYSIEINYASPPHTAITSWEFDNLVRRRIAENIVAAVSTLKSLSQLVSEIPNMVVLDHIQTEVLNALESLKQSCTSLREMHYDLALDYAKQAIVRSESAFFDPTMVSMLYFPDEHKYAIYMPLFVPISVPLLVAVLREVRELRTRKKVAMQ
ncbi:2475_t:CDS:10 [Ambispora leptoticha]|uniref:2475_t:CDS:1 n=1 Tax=Ambispora leptoticha TaxID=144679 RepID=A0A9N9AIB2_9GLOM|nr:2475_t:CDS:10 [Ambispora leptoticha]